MRLGGAGAVGRAAADRRAADDQRRLRCRVLGGADRGVDRLDVVAVDRADHVPAIALEALAHVVHVPGLHGAVDADAVVVVQRDQLVQLPCAGQRAGLVADAFHQAAVTQEDVGAVVDHGVAGAVELVRQQLFGQRHAHRVGQALAERAGGGLDARGHVDLGVARGLAVQLAEVAQLAHRQLVAAQVQQCVEQHRGVAVAEHEAVAVGPVRVRRVVPQVPAPQRHRHLGHAHRCAGVAGIGRLHGVHRERADGVGHHVGIGVGGGCGMTAPDGRRARERRLLFYAARRRPPAAVDLPQGSPGAGLRRHAATMRHTLTSRDHRRAPGPVGHAALAVDAAVQVAPRTPAAAFRRAAGDAVLHRRVPRTAAPPEGERVAVPARARACPSWRR